MIATLCRAGAVAAIAALLGACGTTPPSTHYLLTAAVDEIPAQQSPSLGVGPIEIPEYLNRNTVVYRGPDNELIIDRETRWAEPLEDGIGRVVSLNLASLLDTGNIRDFPWHPRRPPDYGVSIRVLRMDAANAEAVLVAEWVILRPGEESELRRGISRHTMRLDSSRSTTPQLPAAHSALFYKLSQDIAAAIPRGEDPA